MGMFSRNKQRSGIATTPEQSQTIDLRTDVSVGPKWGFPTRCPECSDFGYLDRIDVVNEVMYQHCPTCWARWETPRSATVADA